MNSPTVGSKYAETLRSSTEDLISFIESLDDRQWATETDLEGWPIGVVAHHLAVAAQFVADLALSVANGEEIGWTMEFIHDVNAQYAEAFATITKQEALEALEFQSAGAVEKISQLSEAQLRRRVNEPMAYGEGFLATVEEIIQAMLINHVQSHLESIRSSVSRI